MKITLEVIPHSQQRLPGSIGGDWVFDVNGDLTIKVSDLGDWRMNFLFARHELDEAMLCKHVGITTEMVDADELKATPDDDPDSLTGYPGSCYQQQHNDALVAEWIMSRLLGVSWKEYGARCEALTAQNNRSEAG